MKFHLNKQTQEKDAKIDNGNFFLASQSQVLFSPLLIDSGLLSQMPQLEICKGPSHAHKFSDVLRAQ